MDRARENPPPLVVAASLVAVEGLVLVLLSVLEMASLDSTRVAMGLTTAVFFLVYGVGLVVLGWMATRGASWTRSPIVLAQLIQLGVAQSFWGGDTTWVAVVLGLVAVLVVVGLLHPASLEALREDAG